MRTLRSGGFTFVELMVSMTIVGLLSSIAVPKYQAMKRKATASQVLGDFGVVRVAVLNFFADSGYYPVEATSGTVPQNLAKYLPLNFTFRKPQWTLDYERVVVKGNNSKKNPVAAQDVVAVAVTTADPLLGTMTMGMLGTGATIMVNGRLTFFIAGM
jgi:prepilin-type N-terminal cleavage/methylation domain-containing protein